MRSDMKKLLCERQRIGSSAPSMKTGKRLNPNLDYEDYDTGPSRISSSRRRQHGWLSKELNENLNPLERFLYAAIGRPWNDVYSEIRENLRPSSAVDYHVLFHLDFMVDLDVYMDNGIAYNNKEHRWGRDVARELFVHPVTGILSKNPQPARRVKPLETPDSLHWHDNVWFRCETFRTEAKCGCVHFREQLPDGTSRFLYITNDFTPAICIHGNKPIARELWYVIEYGYHHPDEVYRVYHYADSGAALRFGLTVLNPVHKIYYRDVPKEMAKAFEIRKKSANKKELAVIRELLKK